MSKKVAIRISSRQRNETRILRIRLRDYQRLKAVAQRNKCTMMDIVEQTLDVITYEGEPPPEVASASAP
jgi:hypothetical protein